MANADSHSHQQKYNKNKLWRDNKTNPTTGFTTISNTVIGNIMHQHIILVLMAINSFEYFGFILQHFLFDIQHTNPLTFTLTIKTSAMPPQCAPKLCVPQALKGSSPYENYIAIHILPQIPLSPSSNNSDSLHHKSIHHTTTTATRKFSTHEGSDPPYFGQQAVGL